MSDVKKPIAGEWWEIGSGFRVRVIGRKLDGIFLCEEMSGKVDRFDIKNAHWTHLPDCDSFDWKPEVFPQYWTTLDRQSNSPMATAFIIRTSKHEWNLVRKDGVHGTFMGEVSNWSPSGRTQLTKEQAEALLLPKESPEDWVVQDLLPARIGIDQFRYPTSGQIRIRDWNDVTPGDRFSSKDFHGKVNSGNALELRCRRKDMERPKAETRTVVIIRWLCWNEDGKERLIHAANRPSGFLNCENRGEEKFEVTL
jgi:hypothetical protein